MKQLSIFLIALIAIVSILSSCSDEETSIVGTWVMTAFTVDTFTTGSGPQLDIFNTEFDECDKDDRLVISDDGTFEFNEGPNACPGYTVNEVYDDGNYVYNETAGTLTITSAGSTPDVFTNVNVSSGSMTAQQTDSDGWVYFYTFSRL
jgi:hypothetical protein